MPNAIQGASSTSTVAPSPSTPAAPALDVEGVVAEVSVRLEQSQERLRDSERQSRRRRTEARRDAIGDKREAAALRLAGTVLQSAASAAASGVQIGSASRSSAAASDAAELDRMGIDVPDTSSQISEQGKGVSGLISAGGGALGAGMEFAASRRDSAAEGASLAAEERREHADMLGDAAESAERFADKAVGHLEAIARAKHEAMMAALRG